MTADGRYAGNAGAISGDGHGRRVCRKCRSNFRRVPEWPTCARAKSAVATHAEMQEQFLAGAPKPKRLNHGEHGEHGEHGGGKFRIAWLPRAAKTLAPESSRRSTGI